MKPEDVKQLITMISCRYSFLNTYEKKNFERIKKLFENETKQNSIN